MQDAGPESLDEDPVGGDFSLRTLLIPTKVVDRNLRRHNIRTGSNMTGETDHRPAQEDISKGYGHLLANREDDLGRNSPCFVIDQMRERGMLGGDLDHSLSTATVDVDQSRGRFAGQPRLIDKPVPEWLNLDSRRAG